MTIQKHYAYFSAAIRDGARLTAKGLPYVLLDEAGGTCAIGAGAMAIGLPTQAREYDKRLPFLPTDPTLKSLREMYPYLWTRVACPVCGADKQHDLLNVVADLYDVAEWTREQIADWLYAEEEKLGFITISEEGEAFNDLSLETANGEKLSPASLPEPAWRLK